MKDVFVNVIIKVMTKIGKIMNKKFNKSIFFCSILPYVLVVLLVFTTQSISTSVVLRALKSNAIDIAENSFKANINVIGENVHNADV